MISCYISGLQLQSCNHFHEIQPWTMLFWRSELEMLWWHHNICCGAGDPHLVRCRPSSHFEVHWCEFLRNSHFCKRKSWTKRKCTLKSALTGWFQYAKSHLHGILQKKIKENYYKPPQPKVEVVRSTWNLGCKAQIPLLLP